MQVACQHTIPVLGDDFFAVFVFDFERQVQRLVDVRFVFASAAAGAPGALEDVPADIDEPGVRYREVGEVTSSKETSSRQNPPARGEVLFDRVFVASDHARAATQFFKPRGRDFDLQRQPERGRLLRRGSIPCRGSRARS